MVSVGQRPGTKSTVATPFAGASRWCDRAANMHASLAIIGIFTIPFGKN
jgi:hypothetical protein